jgi:hypothetical protein
VSRTLPDTLRVDIRERLPLALAELERLYLMDGTGTLIDLYGPRTSGFDLPIVRGLIAASGEQRRDRAEKAGALLRDLGDLGAEVSELEVEPSGDLKLVLRGKGELLRMGLPPYRARFLTYLGLREELARRCPDAAYFDLRFKDRIFVKHRNGPGETVERAAVEAESAERPTAPPFVGPPAPAEVPDEHVGMGTDEPAAVSGER